MVSRSHQTHKNNYNKQQQILKRGESDFQTHHTKILKTSSFKQQQQRHEKKQENMNHTQKNKQSIGAVLEKAHILDLLDKDLKSALLNVFKELKEIMYKEPERGAWWLSWLSI